MNCFALKTDIAQRNPPFTEKLELLQRLNPNPSKGYCSVIALQHDRPRLVHILIQMTTSTPVHLQAIMYFDPVEHYGDKITADGGLGGLPLTWFTGNKF